MCTKPGLDIFYIRHHLGRTASGQMVDNLRTHGNPKFDHLLTKCYIFPKMHLYNSISGLGKFWTTIILSNPEIVQILSTSIFCLKIVQPWKWDIALGQTLAQSRVKTNPGQRQ